MKAVILLAEGFEEVEALTPADYLRRAGVHVILAGVTGHTVTGSRDITVCADIKAELIEDDWTMLILPGGLPGAENLAASDRVRTLCEKAVQENRILAAICASPALVLNKFGLLKNRRFTCYPGFETQIEDGEFQEDRVVEDGNIITSRGPGTAGEFSLRLVRKIAGTEAAAKLKNSTLL